VTPRRLLALFLAALGLAGCAAAPRPKAAALEARPAGALKSTDADSAACLSQGHPIGTDDYARCLLRLAEQRRGEAGRAMGSGETLKLGGWCWSATAPEPFRCHDI
jgi:hypothetical protein